MISVLRHTTIASMAIDFNTTVIVSNFTCQAKRVRRRKRFLWDHVKQKNLQSDRPTPLACPSPFLSRGKKHATLLRPQFVSTVIATSGALS
jgi:hypothetical protein